MAEITKVAAVLKRSRLGYTDFANFIPFEGIDANGVIVQTVVLARKDVDEMGWPEKITVTIEPGDTLNEVASSGS